MTDQIKLEHLLGAIATTLYQGPFPPSNRPDAYALAVIECLNAFGISTDALLELANRRANGAPKATTDAERWVGESPPLVEGPNPM